MNYREKFCKFGELIKMLKLYIIMFSAAIVADYTNFPSKIIDKYGVVPFFAVFMGACLFVVIYLIQNKIHKSFKAKNANEFDSFILLTTIFASVYLIIISITPPHKPYKAIILLITIFLSLGLFIFRLYVNLKSNISDVKNTNVYDLKDFMESKEIVKNNDYPILFAEKDVSYDLFNRDVIINKLYASIQACKGSDYSFVIGLEGPWGSGKTTIVNNVIKKLEEASSDFIIIDDFDPWTYNNQKVLLTTLFDKVLKRTGINYSKSSLNVTVNTLFDTIRNSHPIGNFMINVFLENDLDDGVKIIKERIQDCLELNNKTIVIFIDNLDRASSSNIIFLLKIINIIFDLKRVVYVLSYDKERMNELLVKNSNINEKYIEKIVQQEISITKLNKQKIHMVVNDCMTKLFDVYGVKKESNNDFVYIIDYLSGKISDLREFKRILNSIVPNLSFSNGLYQPDLFALEIIRFENNGFYEEICNNSKYYISLDFDTNAELFKTSFNKEKFNQEGKEYFKKVEEKYGKAWLVFASNIFPNIKKYLNNINLRSEYENRDDYKEISLKCRAASAKYFDSYFNYDENEYILISKVYNNFINQISSKNTEDCYDDIIESFNVFFAVLPKDYHEEIINKFWLARNDFDINLSYPILIGLINNSHKINKENSFLALSPYQRASAIMATLFSLLNEEKKLKVLSYLKKDVKLLNLCRQITYWLNSSSLHYENKESDVSAFKKLMSEMCNVIIADHIDIYSDENYGIHNSLALLQNKREELNLDENADVDIVDYISSIIKPMYIYRILIDAMGTSSSSKGYGYYLNERGIKCFFENENIISECFDKYPPTNDIESLVYEVYQVYKSGEADCFGDKVVYRDNYIDLSQVAS